MGNDNKITCGVVIFVRKSQLVNFSNRPISAKYCHLEGLSILPVLRVYTIPVNLSLSEGQMPNTFKLDALAR